MAQWLTNPTRNHEVAGSILGIAQREIHSHTGLLQKRTKVSNDTLTHHLNEGEEEQQNLKSAEGSKRKSLK